MRESPCHLVLFALIFQLSCAPISIGSADPLASPSGLSTDVTPIYGPTAVDWVHARFSAHQTGLADFEVRSVAEAVVAQALANGLSWDLVLAVIHTESGFHNFARSRVGALGLMQLMPATAKSIVTEGGDEWRGPASLFEPQLNVALGTRYLSHLHRRYGHWDRALAAYNWGPARIDSRLRRGRALPARYVSKVYASLYSSEGL